MFFTKQSVYLNTNREIGFGVHVNLPSEIYNNTIFKFYENNSKYIIPGSRSMSSRFYIDEDGKFYDVSGLYNDSMEEYFRELVNYDE